MKVTEEKMGVQVVLFDVGSSRVQRDLTGLCPNVEVPRGFVLKGGGRKFIVLKGKDDIGRDQVVIAIGPPLTTYYYHKDILASSRQRFSNLKISGGGEIGFTYGSAWLVEFRGSSGDYGVFDPVILTTEIRQAITTALGMEVSMKWEW